MGKYYCCMTNCHNYSGKVGKFDNFVTLHKLPKDQYVRRAWIRSISRKYWKPTNYTRVCSDHFKDGKGPSSLERNKIPTCNLAQKDSSYIGSKKSHSTRVYTSRQSCSTTTVETKPVEIQDEQANTHSSSGSGDCTSVEATRVCVETIHTYARSTDVPVETELDTGDTSQSTQCGPNTSDAGIFVTKPEITIEDIKDSDDKVQFYTGFTNYHTFNALYETLLECGAEMICTNSDNESRDKGRKRKLRTVDEFLLVMMRLRLGLLVKDLEFRFKVASSTVTKIFKVWISFMFRYLQSLVFLPSLDVLKLTVPSCFKHFSDTRIILDCTEIFIQTPSSLENQSLTYSNYKSHNTFKVLIGVSMTGAVVLISKLWGGCASDVEITRNSGLLDILEPRDAVMVDKGFIHLKKDLDKNGVKLYCPPFKTKNQFSKSEVEITRRIASARIHVERKMEQLKNFRILQGIMPLAISKQADEIVFVCGALTNLLPPLVV